MFNPTKTKDLNSFTKEQLHTKWIIWLVVFIISLALFVASLTIGVLYFDKKSDSSTIFIIMMFVATLMFGITFMALQKMRFWRVLYKRKGVGPNATPTYTSNIDQIPTEGAQNQTSTPEDLK